MQAKHALQAVQSAVLEVKCTNDKISQPECCRSSSSPPFTPSRRTRLECGPPERTYVNEACISVNVATDTENATPAAGLLIVTITTALPFWAQIRLFLIKLPAVYTYS